MTDERQRQARSFGAAADVYERARPGYPDAAVDWLLEGAGPRVVDVGAGTGKLTRSLVARGLDVVAVEPLAGMRAELQRVLPDVRVLEGTAEQLPLPDAAADVVLAAQAWHWVDVDRAGPETARVLAPGGRLGLVWNSRDESVPWVGALGALLARGAAMLRDVSRPDVGAAFSDVEHHEVAWTEPTTPAGVVELVASRSWVITLAEPDRAALLDRVRDLLATHPDTRGRAALAMPYRTVSTRARLRPRG